MFSLIIALTFNPVNHVTSWEVTEKTFNTVEQCDAYAVSEQGQAFLKASGALSYTCDTLKGE